MSITHTLVASFAMFPTVFNTYKKRYIRSCPKKLLKRHLIAKFVIDMIDSNWTLCRTIQGVIVLVISNQPCTSRSSDFEITHTITP